MSFEHAEALIAMGIPRNKIEVLCGADHGVPDPYGFGIGIYRSSRDIIKRSIEKYFSKIRQNIKENEDKDSQNE